MKKEDAEEYTQSLGQIVGGSWRQIALAKRLGVPKALGLSVEVWVEKHLGGYVRRSVEDRREAVKELAAEGMSQRAIGEVLGVHHSTVAGDLESGGNPPLNDAKASENAVSEVEDGGNPPLSAVAPELTAAPVSPEPLSVVAALAADDRLRPTARPPHVTYNSGENEWYTPAEHIARVRAVLGEIDLDPASCEVANKVVGAKRYYSIEDDGLCQEWEGRCFLNPPYAAALVAQFIDKLIASTGVTEAVVLVNNATETRWGQALQQAARAICFPAGRVRFWGPRGAESCPVQGQLFAYLGPKPEAFAEHFGGIGRVWMSPPTAGIALARPLYPHGLHAQ